MKKIFIALVIFFSSFSLCFADEKFANSYYITYQITNSGLANVTEEIIITNKTSDYYPSDQTFSYHSFNLGNVRAYDEKGEFAPEIAKEGSKTDIHVKFREPHVGIGKQTKLTLNYQTSDMASLNGEVWQILIPGIKNLDFYDDFRLKLEIPENFPENQYVSIPPSINFEWTKNEIRDKGIVLIFGKNQYYKLSLNYFLQNTGITSVLSSITIPPNTNYQDVFLKKVSPEPVYSEKDPDENWILWFSLDPTSSKMIKVDMLVHLFFDPKTGTPLSNSERKTYLAPLKFWDYQNFSNYSSRINNLKSPREIYDFTANSLTYNFNRLNKTPERYTASEILKNPINAICTDFTNVFISIARKNGIPAREINGYAYTQNYDIQPLSLDKDILHAWPEYYDSKKGMWIMVDPTWGNTTGGIDYFEKIDLNHIVFVKKGVSSETPYPAGSYKNNEHSSKDVNVAFSSLAEWNKTSAGAGKKIDLTYDVNEWPVSGINMKGKIIIQNKSGAELTDLSYQLQIDDKTLINKNIPNLIPYQIHEKEFDLPRLMFWQKKDITLTTFINNRAVKKVIHYTPIYLWKNNIYYFIGGTGALLILMLILGYTIIRRIKFI